MHFVLSLFIITFVFYYKIKAEVLKQNPTSSHHDDDTDIFQVEIGTKNIGRIKYEDGEVILYQNQQKLTDFFITPFPRVNPENSKCHENILSGHIELSLSVDLYTSNLIEAVDTYLKKHFSTLCNGDKSCEISLLPMNAIRLVQKGLRTNKTRENYIINSEWHSNTLLLQSVDFTIYAANQSVCQHLLSSITGQCRLSNFEVHYSLRSEKTIKRQIEVTSEHVMNTSMYNDIQSKFPRSETIVLTGTDFKNLINEITDQITMKVRIEEGFDTDLQDLIGLEKLLERQLQFKQVQLEKTNDRLWDSLYWTNEVTRPDRLAKFINTVVRKNLTDTDQFVYDSKAAKNVHDSDLTHHDIDQFEQLDKHLSNYITSSSSSNSQGGGSGGSVGFLFGKFRFGGSGSRSHNLISQQSEDTNTMTDSTHHRKTNTNHLNVSKIRTSNDTEHILSKAELEQYLNELSDHIHLEGEIILPKAVDVRLIKHSSLRAKTKLFSHTMLIRTRSNIHVLPLRCPMEKKSRKSMINTVNQVDQLTDSVEKKTDTATTYFYSGQLPTSNEWEADLIFNGNFSRFCEKLGKKFVSADNVINHFTGDKIDRGGYFYTAWYYVGPRHCIDDIFVYRNNPTLPIGADNPYTVWKYSGTCGCCINIIGWTYKRRAFITCT